MDLEWLNTDNDESKHVCMLHLDKGHLSLAKGSEGISREKTSFTLAFCLRAGSLTIKRILPKYVNASQDCGVWMILRLSAKQLKTQSYMS